MQTKKSTQAQGRKSKGDLRPLTARVGKLEKDLAAALADADRLKDIAARAQADLQNAKIRLQRDATEIRKFAVEGLMEKLLPTIDNFQRAFSHLPEELRDHDWVKGLQATEQALMNDLSAVGLRRMQCEGQPVDPSKHEVLQAGKGPKDTVVQVLENGYELHGKVLRPAKVVVGAGQ